LFQQPSLGQHAPHRVLLAPGQGRGIGDLLSRQVDPALAMRVVPRAVPCPVEAQTEEQRRLVPQVLGEHRMERHEAPRIEVLKHQVVVRSV
jgi:hypothetical protein